MAQFGRDSMKWDDDGDDWEPSEPTNKPFESVGTSVSQRSFSFHSPNVAPSINFPPKSSTQNGQHSTSQTQEQASNVQPSPQTQVSTSAPTVTSVSNTKPSFIVPQKVNPPQNQTSIPSKQVTPQKQPSQPLVQSKSQTFLKPSEKVETNSPNSPTTKSFDKPLPQHRQSSPSLLLQKTLNSQNQTTTTGTKSQQQQQQQQQPQPQPLVPQQPVPRQQNQNQNQNLQPIKTQVPSFPSTAPKQQNVQPSKVENQPQSIPEKVSTPNQQLRHTASVSSIGSTDTPKNPIVNAQVSKGISFGDRLRAQQLGGADQVPRRPSITEPETTGRRNSGADESILQPQPQSHSPIVQSSNDGFKQQESTQSKPKAIVELENTPESSKSSSKNIVASKKPEAVQQVAPKVTQSDQAKQQHESESLSKLKSVISTFFHPGSSDFETLPAEAKILVEKLLALN